MIDRFKNLCIYECTDPSRIKTDSKTTVMRGLFNPDKVF